MTKPSAKVASVASSAVVGVAGGKELAGEHAGEQAVYRPVVPLDDVADACRRRRWRRSVGFCVRTIRVRRMRVAHVGVSPVPAACAATNWMRVIGRWRHRMGRAPLSRKLAIDLAPARGGARLQASVGSQSAMRSARARRRRPPIRRGRARNRTPAARPRCAAMPARSAWVSARLRRAVRACTTP